MSERVAIVGSREGADLEAVEFFVFELRRKHPDTILVSGGAKGVDHTAEQAWLAYGGQVESFRPVQLPNGSYGVEKWEYGGPHPRVFVLADEPTWENYKSACLYRDILIAETADRIVAFYREGFSPGAKFTTEMGRAYNRPTYEYERAREYV